MADLKSRILAEIAQPYYQPLKPKALARKLGLIGDEYDAYKTALRELVRLGRLEISKGNAVRAAGPHGTLTGTFRKTKTGFGFVRANPAEGHPFPEIYIPADATLDASSGDKVLVRIGRKPRPGNGKPAGTIVQVLERAAHQFEDLRVPAGLLPEPRTHGGTDASRARSPDRRQRGVGQRCDFRKQIGGQAVSSSRFWSCEKYR